jgi:hypothetical protein
MREYKGVYDKGDGTYAVVLEIAGKRTEIASYPDKQVAAQRWDDIVTCLFSDFAPALVGELNFPDRDIPFGDIARADTLLHKAGGLTRRFNQSSGPRGIRYDESKDAARTRKWTAYLTLSMPRRSSIIGRYLTKEDAIKAYNAFLDEYELTDYPRMEVPETE